MGRVPGYNFIVRAHSVMRGLVRGIDTTMKELASSVKTVSGTMTPFQSLEDNDDIKGYLDYVADSLMETSMTPRREPDSTAQRLAGGGRPAPPARQLGRGDTDDLESLRSR